MQNGYKYLTIKKLNSFKKKFDQKKKKINNKKNKKILIRIEKPINNKTEGIATQIINLIIKIIQIQFLEPINQTKIQKM